MIFNRNSFRRSLFRLFLFLAFFILPSSLFAQNETVYIWRNVKGMKNQQSVMFVHRPSASVKNTGAAVIICPGGSYHHLGLYNEGYCSSMWFSERGVTAFMLKYRTNESGYNHPAMIEDLQRAIQLVRENAAYYGIKSDKVGVIGYSAGGHLVTMAGVYGARAQNELEKLGIKTEVSLCPDFVVPVYPVVSMQDDIAHHWSRNSLLGKGKNNQTAERKNEFSMELQIVPEMPPVYIAVAEDDDVVDCRNSLRLYESLEKNHVRNIRLAFYKWGGHGFGMKDCKFLREFQWNKALWQWLCDIKIVE